MFIVAESGDAIFNVDTSSIISICKFKSGDEEKWAVCCDYSMNDDEYHLLTQTTTNRDKTMSRFCRITKAIENGDRFLDLNEIYHKDKFDHIASVGKMVDGKSARYEKCMNCEWYEGALGVCMCDDSESRVDFRDDDIVVCER